MKCITIGGATVDIIAQVSAQAVERLTMHNTDISFMMLALGRKIETDSIEISVGGGAVNASVSMKRQGHTVSSLVKIKDDMNGKKILELLNCEKIDTSNVIKTAKNHSATSILLSSVERDPTVFTYRGANTELQQQEITLSQLESMDIVYITALSGESAKVFPHIVNLANKTGAFVATNPGILQLQRRGQEILDSLKYINCLTINNVEASQLIHLLRGGKYYKAKVSIPDKYRFSDKMYVAKSGLSKDDEHITIASFMKTMTCLGLQYMVITDGKNGAYMGTSEGIYFVPSLSANVKGTIGAGDAFSSTLSTYLADKNMTNEQALLAGVINSASVVSYRDTQTGLLVSDEINSKITDELLNSVIFMPYE